MGQDQGSRSTSYNAQCSPTTENYLVPKACSAQAENAWPDDHAVKGKTGLPPWAHPRAISFSGSGFTHTVQTHFLLSLALLST